MRSVESRYMKRQSGQALAEFLVVAGFVLVPVALGSVYLMKVGNSQHEMHEATRYAAWERTIWSAGGGGSHHKSDGVVLNEAVARVLGEPDSPIDSVVDGKAVKAATRKFDPMLSVDKGDGDRGPIFKEEKGGYHSFSFKDDKAASGSVAKALGSVITFGLDLNDKGLQTSTISWKYDWVPSLDYGWAPMNVSSSNTLLTESWNAGSPDKIKKSIDGIVATTLLKNASIDKGLKLLGGLARFRDFKKLELGKIDVDRLPCHRLAKAKGRLSC
ncbi:hypothetical protein CLH62_12530 [Marinobacter guineae]|jgi:hypothetical protein|uniref:Uncharacterized protein n=1 Tax=Marinobacter guineae TaxID=432303 RepID=A0A2G1VEG5_9GAMM|nr:hypothetical protein [Marinobacter guineae]PHQ25167.1 hypothetical protein CLH62_12530 [Marinobacter guineae]